MSFDEFFLQTRGLAQAFRSEPVIAAIRGVGGIAVTVVEFSSADRQRTAIAWTHLADTEAATALADALERAPRHVTGGTTAIGAAICIRLDRFQDNGFEGARLVIDVSGDGRSNGGVLTSFARDRAVASGITINGLAILNEEPDLDRYYVQNVIGGPAAFAGSAEDYEDFAGAILAKLLREIAASRSRGPPHPASREASVAARRGAATASWPAPRRAPPRRARPRVGCPCWAIVPTPTRPHRPEAIPERPLFSPPPRRGRRLGHGGRCRCRRPPASGRCTTSAWCHRWRAVR